MIRKIFAADLFCGAGGTSCGLVDAAKELNASVNLVAVNHWAVAIKTHSTNHPYAEHLCSSLDGVDPRKVVPGGRLDLLVASPECTHHSVARGGRPVHDQSRASGWHLLRWAELLKIDNILIENVPEYRTWGPIGADGHPLRSRRGETYQAFLNALRSLGYKVEDRILNAADYGDPTTRERLFIIARRGRRPMVWPEPTHGRDDGETLLGRRKKWRAAKEIIDWNLPAESIFSRKRPLAPNTLKRIMAGLRKFGGGAYLTVLNKTKDRAGDNYYNRSLEAPIPTLTTSNHVGLCEPFIIGVGGPVHHAEPRSVSKPLKTVLTRNHFGLVEPFIVEINHGNGKDKNGDKRRCHPIDDPLPTVTTSNGYALVEPFILGQQSCSAPRSVDAPLPTIATAGAIALVQPFIQSYYGNGDTRSVEQPLPTVTTKDRFALVIPKKKGMAIDIRFRMLQPHELARAMSFPDDYKFSGTKSDTVKQIGNAVPVQLARALCMALLKDGSKSSRITVRAKMAMAA